MKSFLFLATIILFASSLEARPDLIKGTTYHLQKNQANYVKMQDKATICPPPPEANPDFITIEQNPNALPGAFYPDPAVSNILSPPPQYVVTTFVAGHQGLDPEFFGTPPDTCGAIGPEQFVMGDNQGIVTFTRSGVREDYVDAENNSLTNLDGDFQLFMSNCDARIRYDAHSDRFFQINLINNNIASGNPSGFNLAYTDSGKIDDDTRWSVLTIFNANVLPDGYGCPGDQNTLYDFPCMGIDDKAIYVALRVINSSETASISATLFVIQKKSLLGDGPVVVTTFRDMIGFPPQSHTAHNPITLQPAMNFDKEAQYGYVITQNPVMYGQLLMLRVVDPGSDSPSITNFMPIDVLKTGSRSNRDPQNYLPFPTNVYDVAGLINNSADTLEMAHVVNGQLFTCHNIMVDANGVGNPLGDRKAARWYQIDVTGDKAGKARHKEHKNTQPALVQAGTLFDPSEEDPLYYGVSAVMSNKRGDVTVCGTVSSNVQPLSAFYTGRLASDPKGTLRIGVAPPNCFALGSGHYTRALGGSSSTFSGQSLGQRWGDFSYTSLDPKDQMTMWTIQEIAVNGVETQVVAELKAP